MTGSEHSADLLGWKAMPFALDDLDSNWLHYLVMITSYAHGSATFVSMFGEDCMLGEGVE